MGKNWSKKPGSRKLSSVIDQEEMAQIYALTGSKSEVARRMGCCISTVTKHLAKVPEAKIVRLRAALAEEMASEVSQKAKDILREIQPVDYKTRLNEAGLPTGGPNLMQKTTSFAIMTDKAIRLEEHAQAIQERATSGAVSSIVPQDVGSLIAAIKNKISSIDVLRVTMGDSVGDDLKRRADMLVEQATQAELAAPAKQIDFDNPA